jgi:integrase
LLNLNLSISAVLLTNRKRASAPPNGGRLKPVSDDELVFKSPEGLPIDDRNFCRRAWKTVLAEVAVKYRKPYTTRKTAINLSLKSGASYIEVAAAAGHDPQTMHKYYSDVIQERSVFVSFE